MSTVQRFKSWGCVSVAVLMAASSARASAPGDRCGERGTDVPHAEIHFAFDAGGPVFSGITTGPAWAFAVSGPARGVAATAEARETSGERKAWLGVQLGDVGPTTSAQLNLSGRGVVVLNVAKDSPAQRAGLEPHDVLLRVDGLDIEGGVAGLTGRLAEFAPGDSIQLDILRGGQPRTVAVELGARAGNVEWSMSFMPDALLQEDTSFRGKWMRLGDDGKWRMGDFGDWGDLDNLPDELRKVLPHGASVSSRVFVDQDRKAVKVKRSTDGQTLSVDEDEDGKITVRRTDADGNTTEKTYADRDALADGDEEAADLLKRGSVHSFPSGNAFGFIVGPNGIVSGFDGVPEDVAQQLAESQKSVAEVVKKFMEEMYGGAGGATPPDADDMNEFFKKFNWGSGSGASRGRGMFGPFGHGGMTAGPFMQRFQGARQTFNVKPDGSIEVRTRKGDSEIIRAFDGEDDLARRAPDLYEKFQDVRKDE